MTDSPTISIVNANDDVRHSLTTVVQSWGFDVASFDSTDRFLETNSDRPSCVLIDRPWSGENSVGLQSQLNERDSVCSMVVIAGKVSVSDAVKTVKAGAVACLERNCSEQELHDAVREALDKSKARLAEKRERHQLREMVESLTEAERSVMVLVAEGYFNKQVARRLGLSLRAVEDRRRRVMQKLSLESFADLMRFVIKVENATFG